MCSWLVALRKESVDRNLCSVRQKKIGRLVALRKESVDRNPQLYKALAHVRWSLSARRAWIEMINGIGLIVHIGVALRKESVDRNDFPVVPVELTKLSLSARRAWIEIMPSQKF